ncbi:MAG TPA: NAD(P)H-hydrate epimerase, partial [bacterium]|nr:NAD(P)H-hydrate epimerase [bacterium]
MKLATAQDMRKVDESAVQAHGLTVPQLMESAGGAVVKSIEKNWAEMRNMTVGILCGKGNNGGDGLVTARLLKQKKVSVAVVL